jgi:hypothetical protein
MKIAKDIMFNKKLKALSELKDVKAEELTAEQLNAVNAELEAEGFGLNVVAKGHQGFTQEQVDAVVADATASLSDKVSALQAKVDEQSTTIAAKDAEIERLENLPVDDNAAAKGGDNAHNSKDKPSSFAAIEERAKVIASTNK